MSQGKRLGVLAIVIVVGIVAFIIAKPGDSKKAPPPPVHVQIVGGKPVGGIHKLLVAKGQPVRFSVTSDVADEIHVHGYDFHKDVAKGGTVSFDFPAKIDGKFIIELEQKGEQIIDLRVAP